MPKNLRDFSGREAIFIDANIFLHHAFDMNPVSVEFLKAVESSNLKAYTSALVIEEITFKLIMQSASNFLERLTLSGVKTLLRDKKAKERIFKPVIEYRGYLDMLKSFGLTVLDLTDKDMALAIQKAKVHGLVAADAAHLAVMERKGIVHMASGDRDFELVDDLTLWSPMET